MIKLYLVSIIISIMIITIVCFSRSRTSTTLDFTFVFMIKLYFGLIPILNLIISLCMLYIFIGELIDSNSLKKNS